MSNEVYSLTREDLTEQTNRGIDCLLKHLLFNDVITPEKFKEISQYRIIVSNKSMWARLGDLLWKDTSDSDRGRDKNIVVHVKD